MTKPKKKKANGDSGPQRREVSSNECAVCFSLYDEDIDSETGDLMSDWIQCTNDGCGVWVHTECLDKCDVTMFAVSVELSFVKSTAEFHYYILFEY